MLILEKLNRVYRDAEGGGSAGGGEGGDGGGDAAGNATDDGMGGKASMLSGDNGGGEGGDDGGSKQLDVKGLLGEDLSGNENISKFLDTENPVQEMAKSLLEAQKQIGKPKVGIPDDKTSAEDKASFYKELGVPDDIKGYGFEKPEGISDEAYNQEHSDKWAETFKSLNVPKETANALRAAQMQEYAEAQEQGNAALSEKMDAAFGDKKGVVTQEIGSLLTKAVPDAETREQIQALLTNENTPAFALALGHVQQYMKKTYGLSDSNNGDGEGANGGKTVDELRGEAQKLMASPAYSDPMNKGHAEAKKTVNQMYKDIGVLTSQKQSA